MAIAKKGYTTVNALTNEVLTEISVSGTIQEEILKRWANLRNEEILGPEQLVYSLALLDVKNGKALLPDGLHSIYVAVLTGDNSRAWNKEMLVGYTKEIHGTDCDVEVNLLCPVHGKSNCECQSAVIDVQVDDLYLMSRPYLYAMTSKHYIGYAAATTDGFPTSSSYGKCTILTPRKTNEVIWNSKYFLGICQSLGSPECYTYEIEPPYFITDLDEGQVLLAFLRYPKDEEGYYLIPNHPLLVQAITAFMTEKLMWREYMHNGNQTDRLRWIDAKKQADILRDQAITELEMPEPDKWTRELKQHWVMGPDRFHYGSPR